VPMVEGLASVVIAKTTMTIAQVVFILLGIALAFWTFGAGGSSGQTIAAALVSVVLLMLGTAAFVFVQHKGLFSWLLEFQRKIGLKITYLETREKKLRSLDRTILDFYRDNRLTFTFSTVLFLLGWMAEAVEAYLILYFLGSPTTALSAISIGALASFIKSGTFIIPGSLGAQEGGNMLLLRAFGYSDVTGITFSLFRRFRELVWTGLGLLCLALIGRRAAVIREGRADDLGNDS
jgi:glycosyltransferase 2 family protein